MSDNIDQRRSSTRPPVTLPSLVGAAAGILLLGSLSGFLSELSGERLRVGGLGLSLIFEAIGVVLLVLGQNRRSYTAGVVLAALGVIPLVFFTFFDVRNQTALVGGDDITLSASVALLVAAGVWLAGHVFGPSRSHVLFLGAALVAVWLAVTIQVVDESAQPDYENFQRPAPALVPHGARLAPANVRTTVPDEDPGLRISIEGERYMAGEVLCDSGELQFGNADYWSCEGPWPYPSELEDSNEFLALEGEFNVNEDDLDLYGPYDSDEVYERLDEFERYDRGLVTCIDEVPSGSEDVWFCESGELGLWPLEQKWSQFSGPGSEGSFDFDDGSSQFDDEFQFDDDEFQFDDDYYYSEGDPFEAASFPFGFSVIDASHRFGWVTLVFGLLYMGGGAFFDRRGDSRRGTAFFAVASPLAYLGTTMADLEEMWAFGLVFALVGTLAAKLGTDHDRRFTAWSGTLVASIGLIYMVADMLGGEPSGTALGIALLVVGLAMAAGARLLDGDAEDGIAPVQPQPAPLPSPAAPEGSEGPGAPGGSGQPVLPPSGPPLVPPPASHQVWSPAHTTEQQWAPATPEPGPGFGSAAPEAFDPRPPGSSEPLPPG